MREHSAITARDLPLNLTTCTYCGEIADSIDHVPPQSARANLIAAGWKGKFIEVDACRECNTLLGARSLFTVAVRRKFIAKALGIRKRKLLAIPGWSSAEIEGLGDRGILRDAVDRGLLEREITLRRIRFALSGQAFPFRIVRKRPLTRHRALPGHIRMAPDRSEGKVRREKPVAEKLPVAQCKKCSNDFPQRRRDQPFCSYKCRIQYAKDFGLRGKVSKVSICQGGEISIVLRFGIEERERAQRITPGTVLSVIEA